MDILHLADSTLKTLPGTLLLGFVTVVLLLWYSSQKQSYWKRNGIPFVKPLPFLGSIHEMIFKSFQDIDLERLNKYGRIYGHYEGNRPVLTISDPELLRYIFVKDFYAFSGRRRMETGDKILENMMSVLQREDWKRLRNIITPTFTTGKIKRMMSIFTDCSKTLVKNFKVASEKVEPVDTKSFFGAFTMDVIASAAFSTKIDSHNDPNNQFVKAANGLFFRKMNWRFLLFVLCPGIVKLFKISLFSPKYFKFFSDVILQMVEERKRSGEKRNDFLQLLMDITEEVDQDVKPDLNEDDDLAQNYGKVENSETLKSPYSKKSLSHEELVAQCVMFFVAGYDAVASTLAITCYYLALNADIQDKLTEEIDEAVELNNGEVIYDAIQNMKYLDNVIAETMRLYPATTRLDRVADEEYKLADTGVTVAKDMVVIIPVYTIHRDPKLFPNPEKFDPDRFTAQERDNRAPCAYIPFGAGPRTCVAMRFALTEIKVCLAHVLRNFKIKISFKSKEPLEFYSGFGLLQLKTMPLVFEARKDSKEQ